MSTTDTYTMLDGRVLDLTRLTPAERAYLQEAYAAYRRGMAWEAFSRFAVGPQHPLLRATAGRVTPAVWAHPLYQAVSDLEYRLGITQGEVAPDPGDDATRDPLASAALAQA